MHHIAAPSGGIQYGRNGGIHIYRGNSQEHLDELLVAQDGVTDQSIGEARKASAALLNEVAVSRWVIAVDY